MTTPTVIAALIEAANEIERLGGDPSRFHKVAHESCIYAQELSGALRYVCGCFDDAIFDGLIEVMASSPDDHLKEIIWNRLMPAHEHVREAIARIKEPA
jgi:hypothetical protein